MGILVSGKDIMVACMNSSYHSYHVKARAASPAFKSSDPRCFADPRRAQGKKQWSLTMPARILAISPMVVRQVLQRAGHACAPLLHVCPA